MKNFDNRGCTAGNNVGGNRPFKRRTNSFETASLNFIYITIFLLFGLFSVFFMSCNARIEGYLTPDGASVVSVNTSLEPRMTTLLRSLAAAGGQTDGLVLNGPSISMSMSRAPGVAEASLRNTSVSSLDGFVHISQIRDFLSPANTRQAPAQRGFITFEQGGGANSGAVNSGANSGRCVITISRQNGPMMLELLSPEISDYLHALMAPLATGEEMSKSEYLSLVASFYNRTISDEIAHSRILASIDFPGPISSIRGGTFTGRKAFFDIPLLDLLVAETPLVYEVTWN